MAGMRQLLSDTIKLKDFDSLFKFYAVINFCQKENYVLIMF